MFHDGAFLRAEDQILLLHLLGTIMHNSEVFKTHYILN